jgi:hypothetical protein
MNKQELAEQILEGNKLIAEFVGYKQHNHGSYKTFEIDGRHIYESVVQYNTKWEWLMPVVEKIESLGFQFHIGNEGAAIKKWWFRGNVPDLGSVQETKIAATWEICIRFIQWYNNQTPTK